MYLIQVGRRRNSMTTSYSFPNLESNGYHEHLRNKELVELDVQGLVTAIDFTQALCILKWRNFLILRSPKPL